MPLARCVAADCDAEVPSYGNRFDLLTVVLGGEDPSFCHKLQSIIYFIGISKNKHSRRKINGQGWSMLHV